MANVHQSLAEYRLLEDLPEPWLDQLARLGRRTSYSTGTRIFAEGGRAEHFWLVTSGDVALDLHVPGRGDVVIETIHPGSVLGWSWMFPPYRWHFGAVAAEQVHAIQFNGVDVLRLCRDDPARGLDLMGRFAGVVIDRLQSTRMRLLDLYGYPA